MTQSPLPEGEVAAAGLSWLLETFVSPFVEAATRPLFGSRLRQRPPGHLEQPAPAAHGKEVSRREEIG